MKRRIFVIDFGLCNFHNLLKLVESGHRVFVSNSIGSEPELAPFKYYESLGLTIVDDIDVSQRESVRRKWLKDNNIDTIINTWPSFTPPKYYYTDYNYIGLTELAGHLETRKLKTRNEVESLGIKLPKILDELTVPCVVKPRKTSNSNGDSASICLTEEHIEWVKHNQPDYYIEEYIPDNIETNVEFVTSGGKWSILHHQQVMGEDTAKMAGGFTHWTRFAGYNKLSDENRELTLKNASIILDYIAGKGGDYCGQVTGLIKDGEWYFCEINVRPEQSNSLPQFITGDEWLDAMSGNPEILGDSFPWDVQKVIVQPQSADVPYPFHLHEKYGVNIPCGLDIIQGKHRLSRQFRERSPTGCIGIIICDREIPQDFIDEIENNSKYSVSHCFI